MQVEFGRLVTALGQAVSEAQRAVAAHAIGNYLALLPARARRPGRGRGLYTQHDLDPVPPIHRRRGGGTGCGALGDPGPPQRRGSGQRPH